MDSCNAEVKRALLFFKVDSSTSHFFALAELQVNSGGFKPNVYRHKTTFSTSALRPVSAGRFRILTVPLRTREDLEQVPCLWISLDCLEVVDPKSIHKRE